MLNRKWIVLLLLVVVFFAGCTKDQPEIRAPRVKAIITNTVDVFGSDCSTCFYYQFYDYNQTGKLVSIRDSFSDPQLPLGILRNSPQVYNFYGSYGRYKKIEYNNAGDMFRAGRDSFVYNANHQLIQRFSHVQCETCPSFLVNQYTYDGEGRLIADSSYAGQTNLVPSVILNEIGSWKYDSRGNIIQRDVLSVWPGVSYGTHRVQSAQYETAPNPLASIGLAGYLASEVAFFMSPNMVVVPGYTYEYAASGYVKKIIYKGHVQEFIYE